MKRNKGAETQKASPQSPGGGGGGGGGIRAEEGGEGGIHPAPWGDPQAYGPANHMLGMKTYSLSLRSPQLILSESATLRASEAVLRGDYLATLSPFPSIMCVSSSPVALPPPPAYSPRRGSRVGIYQVRCPSAIATFATVRLVPQLCLLDDGDGWLLVRGILVWSSVCFFSPRVCVQSVDPGTAASVFCGVCEPGGPGH